ncbi:putative R-2,4-dichlorophenoxypropionate dioxygenase [Sphingobium sp. SYK-6]|uniref:TauD/TfdA dioxygenase family protein n=1 Tax=Sphingobium sp. (strain NBRC 103272 / SYK-6) TaxID=627192 RepID=UPI0002276FAE|nr:TauD/TfdA family dioxygenase [Sphingobium sp. SYK-6]BAK67442.1 putative R-2,4-dichlorophenoxypropionate dioxygenase [Sphingobium sp. SYK-6]
MASKTMPDDATLPPPIVAGLPMPEFKRIGVEPISGACGCEISGVDLREPLDSETLAEIMKAFEHFTVIVLRDQNLSPEQHKAFSHHFGEITELPQAPIYGEHRDMQEVRREAFEPENVVPSFEHFHTDSPFLLQPPKCIVMRALEVPRWGGDTAFSNAYLVYEHLSDGMKALLDGLQVVYSGAEIWSKNENLPPEKRLRLRESHDFTEDQLTNTHPAVRVHPVTGRKALFATSAYFKHFVGWNEAESRALLNYLQSLAQHLHYHCRVKWKKDTLIVWDNRFTLHRGVHDFKFERRHLVRTTVKGERPLGPGDFSPKA